MFHLDKKGYCNSDTPRYSLKRPRIKPLQSHYLEKEYEYMPASYVLLTVVLTILQISFCMTVCEWNNIELYLNAD